MKPPAFWQHGQSPPWMLRPLLLPLSQLVAKVTARRVARPGWRSFIPVICCGNASVGGSGKTPLVIDLAQRLQERGRHPAILSRGHGARNPTPRRIDPHTDTAATAGDEPMLLAAMAPTYIGSDRAQTAQLAMADGANVLLMDDGLQNPSLVQTCKLLVVDGGAGFGNGHVMPAGPLREPVLRAACRSQAAIIIGSDSAGARQALPRTLPVLQADLIPDPSDLAALPSAIIAFAGIGRPGKFFATLADAGHTPLATHAFADHRPYHWADIAALQAEAAASQAALVTTAKDFARLPPDWRAGILVLRVSLKWHDEAALNTLLDTALSAT